MTRLFWNAIEVAQCMLTYLIFGVLCGLNREEIDG